jgi:hypothetical protein
MAHCPPEMLDDLASVLAEVRAWPRVVERKPLVFYLGSEPFLHFHLLAGERRRADVKDRGDWIQFELPRPLPAAVRRALRQQLRDSYRARSQPRRQTS